MIFYLSLTIFLFFTLYLASNKGSEYRLIYNFLFFSVIFLVAGLRGDVGQDTYNYQLQYDSMVGLDSLFEQLNKAEPILYLIMYPYKLLFDDFWGFTGFLLLLSLMQTVLLSYATKKMYHRSTFLAIYLVIIYLEYHFNVLRASLALLFFLCSMRAVTTSRKKSIVFFILALLSHLSALVLFPVLLVSLKLKPRYYIFMGGALVGVGACVTIFFGDYIYSKFLGYNLFDTSSFDFPFLVSILLSFLWLAFFFNKKKSSTQFFSLLIFSVAFFSSSFTAIAYRLYFMTFAVVAYVTLYEKVFNEKEFKSQPYFLSLFVLCLWLGFISIKHLVQERDDRFLTGKGRYEFSFSPYSLYYDSKYRKNE